LLTIFKVAEATSELSCDLSLTFYFGILK